MKKKWAGLAVTLMLILSVVLSACGTKDTPDSGNGDSAGGEKKYKIGFANLTENAPFFVDVRKGIEKVAKEKGIELVIADNKTDGATALANAENFITQKVDFVIEFQSDEKFGEVIMDKFNENNIKVIAIDIPMPGAVFFGANNSKAGFLAGEYLGNQAKAQWEGKIDKVIMLELPQSGDVPAKRMQGQLDGLKSVITDIKDSDIIRLDSKNTLEEAKRLMTDVLTTIPDAKHIAILSINDDTALGAKAALEAANRMDHAMIVGQGADQRGREELANEKTPFLGSTGYFPEKYGEYIIPAALDILAGKDVGSEILMEHEFVSKENLKKLYP
ncbi:sugar ABC transporter substrate-binding protein [Paenibacillus mendelii]|uniref:Sugar ABC transporter substrate-binding protein n=1 Tax=Paenibacillus mendelii TaxID=206163 RepID=A0ABV6JBT6_9BACL|nr:sugar ABC transporter substrate-binding protein [Paenibacillus mendelii]MCQ6560690.1 sugar ABC transporter substrate-binding protein [Paenibacillus mendelii]